MLKKNSVSCICCLICIILAMALTGCGSVDTGEGSSDKDTINIALLGQKSYFNSDQGFIPGIEMAVKRMKQELGVTVNVITYDDGGDYKQGVAYATQIAQDPTIAAAISVQDFETIDTAAEIFNDAQKPFIAMDGCYDETSEDGYEYFIADCISADKMGELMGAYAVKNGIVSVVSSHSDTQFEKDEIKGFQAVINTTDTQFVDLMAGPFTFDEFNMAYKRWEGLGFDGIYINFYSRTQGGEIIKMLRKKNPDIVIMSDYALDNQDSLSKFGAYLEGVVIVPLYPVSESKRLDVFKADFKKAYGFKATNLAAQGYDVVCMLAKYIKGGATTGKKLMTKLKSEDGYAGVSGGIRFDGDGKLVVDEEQYYICKDGAFTLLQ